jgi:hypothetical protein
MDRDDLAEIVHATRALPVRSTEIQRPRASGRRLRIAACVLALAPIAAACGSSAGTSASTTTVNSTPSTGRLTTAGPTTSSTSGGQPAAAAFPVGVSDNGRYLVDQHGAPFMVVGDSPQCMSANLSTDDMDYFFADRQSHGFNAAWVNLLCGTYTRGREDATTYDGIAPFTTPNDLSTPNPEYFARMDTMVHLAAERGITLLLNPAETGSFRDLLKLNGIEKSRGYGRFLGERYKDAPNIIWMFGNDYQQDQWPTYDPFVAAMAQGIRSVDPTKLQTAELNYNLSTSYDDPVWPPIIDVASAYTYFPTYDAVLSAYNGKPTQPVIMIETNYEFENNTGGPKTTDETLRRQEYWTMLSGATGQLYGNKYTWGLNDKDWKKHFDTKAVTELSLMVKLFQGGPWQDLVPDQSHQFLTGGAGKYSSEGDVLQNEYATAALTADGSFAVVYVPTERTVTFNLSKLRPGAAAQWFDPTSGARKPAAAPFKTPGKNEGGKHDWVLVFRAPDAS